MNCTANCCSFTVNMGWQQAEAASPVVVAESKHVEIPPHSCVLTLMVYERPRMLSSEPWGARASLSREKVRSYRPLSALWMSAPLIVPVPTAAAANGETEKKTLLLCGWRHNMDPSNTNAPCHFAISSLTRDTGGTTELH